MKYKFKSISVGRSIAEDYYYDTEKDAVISLKRGAPYEMKWQVTTCNEPYVSLTRTGYSTPTRIYKSQIVTSAGRPGAYMEPIPESTESTAVTELNKLIPSSAFMMYSDTRVVSQYFHLGTSIGAAFEVFKKRGIALTTDEVKILLTANNKVITIKKKPITTYSYTMG